MAIQEPKYIQLPIEEWKRMSLDLITIRQHRHVDSKYSHVKCPGCGLNWWAKKEDEDAVYCVACQHEYTLCECGTVLTDEEIQASGDPNMCKPCRVQFCEENDMCPECEKDLIPGENNGMKFLYCPNHCIDEVKMREAI